MTCYLIATFQNSDNQDKNKLQSQIAEARKVIQLK